MEDIAEIRDIEGENPSDNAFLSINSLHCLITECIIIHWEVCGVAVRV